jgi:radical SAM superfamily enzyme YgiQ (UPF0313 family)
MSHKKTVLLIYPHHRYWYVGLPWLPLSSMFLASTLLNAGYKTIIIDDRFSREETLEKITEHIEDTILVGFTTACGSQLKNTIEIIEWIRRDYDVPIVLGGPFPSAEPEMCLLDLPIDYVIVGQGEYNLLKLAAFLTEKGSKDKISNLYWKDAQGIIHKSSQKFEKVNINALPPLPYFNEEVISVERYLHPENRAINYNTSTGCIGRCNFCYWPPTYRYSFFDNDRVINDLKELKKKYNMKCAEFQDPTFFVSAKRTRDLVNRIIEEQLNIKWRCNARVDTLHKYTREDFELIRKAGCYYMYLGLESGSTDMLKMMNKGINPRDAIRLACLARETDIKILVFLLFGMPGETLKHLQETAELLHQLLEVDPSLEFAYSFYTPYPGCKTSKIAEKYCSSPTSVYEYSKFELQKSSLPENDREVMKLKSPWEEDFNMPWFSDDFYREYMDYLRKNIPERLALTSIDGKKKDYYTQKK